VFEDDEWVDSQSEQSELSELSELLDELLTLIHFLKLESIDLIHSFTKELDEVLLQILALLTSLFLTNLLNSTLVDNSEELFEIFFNFLSTSKFWLMLDNSESSDSMSFLFCWEDVLFLIKIDSRFILVGLFIIYIRKFFIVQY
jgi:hypothetical protein